MSSELTDRPLVFAGRLLAAVQFGTIALTLPDVALAFARPVTGVAVLVSLVGVTGLIFGAMAGGIAAAAGPGRTFLAGLLLGAAMSLLQAAMPPYPLFAACRVV